MCLLIAKKAGTKLPDNFEDICERAAQSNQDGMGFAIPSGAFRKYAIKPSDFCKIVRENVTEDDPAIFHWRLSTSGEKNDSNCHPFTLPDGGMFAHNGIVSYKFTPTEGKSDTAVLASSFNNTLSLYYKCQELVSSGNKFAIISPQKELYIIGEEHGEWDDGLWYSNKYWKNRRNSYAYSHNSYYEDDDLPWYATKDTIDVEVRRLVTKHGLSAVLTSLNKYCEDWSLV